MGIKRMTKDVFADVAAATVIFPQKGGQGVLTDGGYLLTAAHCLDYDSDTGMRIALRDHVLFEIETATGEKMQVAPLVIESCSDIAVLGALDGQVFPPKMIEPFETFCDRTRPVRLCRRRFFKELDFRPGMKFRPVEFKVHIRTHKKTWVTGKAVIHHNCSPRLWVEADENIEGGTSGGPIINEAGKLVGLVTMASGTEDKTKNGLQSCLGWALPAWIYRDMCSGKEA